MTMYDKKLTIPVIVIFLVLMTFPVWYNVGKARNIPKPEKPKNATECVAAPQEIRTSHMVLLNDWRDNIVREKGKRFGETPNGTAYERSLQKGCMKCHASKKKFCDTCHEYAAVKPYCWDCHIAPKEMN